MLTRLHNKLKFCKTYKLTENKFCGKELINGHLYLSLLTNIPEGFNPIVGGNLYLNSLTTIPKGFNPVIGGDLWLSSLTSIPEGFNPVVGGNLVLHSLQSIPNGFNPLCSEIYSNINIPFRKIPKNYLFSWQNGKYIKINDFFLEVLNINNNISKCKKINNEIIYLAKDGNIYAFGETEEKAKENLQYEIIKSIIS